MATLGALGWLVSVHDLGQRAHVETQHIDKSLERVTIAVLHVWQGRRTVRASSPSQPERLLFVMLRLSRLERADKPTADLMRLRSRARFDRLLNDLSCAAVCLKSVMQLVRKSAPLRLCGAGSGMSSRSVSKLSARKLGQRSAGKSVQYVSRPCVDCGCLPDTFRYTRFSIPLRCLSSDSSFLLSSSLCRCRQLRSMDRSLAVVWFSLNVRYAWDNPSATLPKSIYPLRICTTKIR